MTWVYKILSSVEWAAAREAGRFEGSDVDRKDGFIHLSSGEQAQETARLHFAGQRHLVLLQIDAGLLGEALKWEASRGGELFPHLYRTLDCDLVQSARAIGLAPDGTPALGALDP